MDGRVFDAMLKTALEEALGEDLASGPPAPKPSRRHRARMRRLLSDRSVPVSGGRGRLPVRWLAAAAVIALLTGTAAGYALGGGARFRQMFEESPWAQVYGGAADTEQLLKMGGRLDTLVVESGGLRFEMLDAVSDGQLAMVSVRLTAADLPEALREDPGSLCFAGSEIVPSGSEDCVSAYGFSIRSWMSGLGLREGEYLLVFTINDAALAQGGRYEIRLRDVQGGGDRTVVLPGTWTLAVTLRPAEVLELRPERVCKLAGADWLLERTALSPLALSMVFSRLSPETRDYMEELDSLLDIAVCMTNGHVLRQEDCTFGLSGSSESISLTVEFQMPIDMERVEKIVVLGEDIFLNQQIE